MGFLITAILLIAVGGIALMCWLIYISAIILLGLSAACFLAGYLIGEAIFGNAGAGILTGMVLTGLAWMALAGVQKDKDKSG